MQTDVLIIGCGIAGATAALELAADRRRRIVVVTRAPGAEDSASTRAQGGIVGRGPDDTPASLAADVLRAGDGLSYPPVVERLAEEGPATLERILVEGLGIEFDGDRTGERGFGLEAAHSRRRILHVGDVTGRAIMSALLKRLAEQPNVELLTAHTAIDLISFPHHAIDPQTVYEPTVCHGAYLLDREDSSVLKVVATQTLLATGGIGQIFLNTSNPTGARGDGLAMAMRIGAELINAEYVQFHPTTLYMPGTTKFLISEAVRGEGGRLLTPDGERFMTRYSPEWLDLAPRDVVARAIYWEMLSGGHPYVLLDIASHQSAEKIRDRFPGIHARCLEQSLDITRQPIPVVPSAHYHCGGVRVDENGRTSINGLWALGEVACTGLHGANRLASTSLLEGLVWADRCAREIRALAQQPAVAESAIPDWSEADLRHDADPALVQGDLQTVRNLMWHYVGLVRSEHRMDRAIRELRHLWLNIEDFYRRSRLSDGLVGLRNAVQTALIVTRAARSNRVSRGCHYREDGLQKAAASRNSEFPA